MDCSVTYQSEKERQDIINVMAAHGLNPEFFNDQVKPKGIAVGHFLTYTEFINKYKFPRVMLVSDGGVWRIQVVFMFKCNKYLAWDAGTLQEAENTTDMFSWDKAVDIIPNGIYLVDGEYCAVLDGKVVIGNARIGEGEWNKL